MPRLKRRSKKADSRAVERLRESIAAGYPWIHQRGDVYGYTDLLGFVTGHFFPFCDLVDTDQEADDNENRRALWNEIRAPILEQHAQRRPGRRPWGWWTWDAPETRRVLG